MKRIIICIISIAFFSVLLNAQEIPRIPGIDELTNRFVPQQVKKPGFWDEFMDAFTPEDETVGLNYSYSKLFPLTMSLNYSFSVLSVGVEFGLNCDENNYHMELYDPKMFLTLNPGLYFRFVSFNCGFGAMMSRYSEIREGHSETYIGEDNSNYPISTSSTITQSTTGPIIIVKSKYLFMLKPSITGYIPLDNEYYYLTFSVGYNYCHDLKEFNGLSFGVGFQWVIW